MRRYRYGATRIDFTAFVAAICLERNIVRMPVIEYERRMIEMACSIIPPLWQQTSDGDLDCDLRTRGVAELTRTAAIRRLPVAVFTGCVSEIPTAE